MRERKLIDKKPVISESITINLYDKSTSVMTNKYFIKSKSINKLNKTLVDIDIGLNFSKVYTVKRNIFYVNDLIVNDYGEIPYKTGHTVKLNVNHIYESKLINEYMPVETHSYGSFKSGKSYKMCKELKIKALIDNNLNFEYDYNEIDKLFYDIETFNLNDHSKVPIYTDKDSYISMISMYYVTKSKKIIYLYYLDQYIVDKSKVIEEFKDCEIIFKECPIDKEIAASFFDLLNSFKNYTCVMGFNSSSSFNVNKDAIIGYDLPWLIDRSHYKLDFARVSHVKNSDSASGYQYNKIYDMPFIYFLDIQVLLGNVITTSDKQTLENRTLNSYLNLFKIPGKKDIKSYYDLQKTFATKNSDITDYLIYGGYDSTCLLELINKSGCLELLIQVGNLLKTPLSYALYFTEPLNICINGHNLFKNAGYLTIYEKFEEKQAIQGAFTFSDLDNCLQIKSNVIPFDFKSEYPSAIVNLNISPETLTDITEIKDEDKNDYNFLTITDDKFDEPITVAFYNKKRGIIPQFLINFNNIRNEAKEQMKLFDKSSAEYQKYNIMQLSAKRIVNSTYGILNSNHWLNNRILAASTTFKCRQVTEGVKTLYTQVFNKNVLFVDTDSIYIDFPYYNSELNEDNITSVIQEKFGKEFILEKEDKFLKYCISPAKKCYFGLTENNDVIIKGLSYSYYTNKMKLVVKDLFRQILNHEYVNTVDNTPEIQTILINFYNYHRNIIISAINAKDLSILEDYVRHLKLSGKNPVSMAIKSRYGPIFNEDKIPVIEINSKEKRVSEKTRYLYDKAIDPREINIMKILDSFMSSICKLTVKKSVLRNMNLPVFTEDRKICYRFEEKILNGISQYKNNERYFFVSLKEFININKENARKTPNNIAIHEVFNDSEKLFRLFLDLDKVTTETKNRILYAIGELLCIEGINWSITHNIAYKNIPDKQSFHCISNVCAKLSVIKNIMAILKPKYQEIDLQVYGTGKSLRFIDSPKINISTKTIDYTNIHVPINETLNLETFVIQNIDDTQEINSLQYSTNKPINIYQEFKVSTDEFYIKQVHKKLSSYYPSNIKMSFETHANFVSPKFSGSQVKIECPLCLKIHERSQIYARIHGRKFVITCWVNQDKKKEINVDFDLPINPDINISNEAKIKATKAEKNKELSEKYVDKYKEIVDFNMNYKKPINVDQFNSNGDINISIPNNKLIIIKSPLGSGKTNNLQKYLENNPTKTVIMLSFRLSFTNAIANKLNLTPYTEIKEELIDTRFHNRLIIQIDSLRRLILHGANIDCIILDECTSLFEQINSSQIHDKESTFSTFCQLLEISHQVICLDGLMSQNLVEYLGLLMNTKAIYFENTYRYPYENNEIDLYVNVDKNILFNTAMDEISSVLNKNPSAKIGIFSTSIRFGHLFVKSIKLAYETKKILFLNGDDRTYEADEKDETVLMAKLKLKYFAKPELIFEEFDIFCYTGTLSAGVSLESHKVDLMLGFAMKQSISINGFTQGLFRIRQRKKLSIYTKPGAEPNYDVNFSPYMQYKELYNKGLHILGPQIKLKCLVKALESQLKIDRDVLLIHWLIHDLGFKINIIACTANDKLDITYVNPDTENINKLFLDNYDPSIDEIARYKSIDKCSSILSLKPPFEEKDAKLYKYCRLLENYNCLDNPSLFRLNIYKSIDSTIVSLTNENMADIKEGSKILALNRYFSRQYANKRLNSIKSIYKIKDITEFNNPEALNLYELDRAFVQRCNRDGIILRNIHIEYKQDSIDKANICSEFSKWYQKKNRSYITLEEVREYLLTQEKCSFNITDNHIVVNMNKELTKLGFKLIAMRKSIDNIQIRVYSLSSTEIKT
jgi:DNA polymerase elongation subunit (family B)